MKICIVCLAKRGGMIHYGLAWYKVFSALKENKVNLIFPNCVKKDNFPKLIEKNKIIFLNIPISKKEYLSFSLFSLFMVWKELYRIKPDVVHFVTPHPFNIPLALLLRKNLKIWTFHDPVPHSNDFFLNLLINKILIKIINKVHVHDSFCKDNAITSWNINSRKLLVIPHPPQRLMLPNRDRSKTENLKLLFFGRIYPYKGLNYFLEMATILEERFPNKYEFIIAGEGNIDIYKNQIEKIKRLNLRNEFIPDSDIAEIFNLADILILPYTNATQSGIIPLAFEAGLTIIATNVGGIPEFLDFGKGGLLVPPEDAISLAKAVEYLNMNLKIVKKMAKHNEIQLNTYLSNEELLKQFIKKIKK